MQTEAHTAQRLLIVDDNPAIHEDIRKVLGDMLRNVDLDQLEAIMFDSPPRSVRYPDCTIDSAYSGEQAVERLTQAILAGHPYDMAFVDVRMPPGIDGIRTIERLWDLDPDLQVVLCTAYSDLGWDAIVDRLGMQDKLLIIKKPFDDCEIVQVTCALLEKRRLMSCVRQHIDHLERTIRRAPSGTIE